MSIYNDLKDDSQNIINSVENLKDSLNDKCNKISEIDDKLGSLIDSIDFAIRIEDIEGIINELFYVSDELKNIKNDLY